MDEAGWDGVAAGAGVELVWGGAEEGMLCGRTQRVGVSRCAQQQDKITCALGGSILCSRAPSLAQKA